MRASKARTGHSTGCACHTRWSACGTSREYREAPLYTRGGSRMPELGPYGSMRGARGNSRPYRDHCSAPARKTSVAIDPTETLAALLGDIVWLGPMTCNLYRIRSPMLTIVL